jgi:hypothetical protein
MHLKIKQPVEKVRISGEIKDGEGNLRKEKALRDDAKPRFERTIVERDALGRIIHSALPPESASLVKS